jgi:hypothetical protein
MTNNKQQTAVDWLIEKHFGGIENCTPDFRHKIEQAKEMGKEQAIRFALCYAFGQYNVSEDLKTHIEKFYEQTYGGGEQ